ncbi:uncharacterized protein LOC125941721 [Dermacentor silvarum]|uniref:uncharacterized protein LOC125941721 n=1 Tax=Dermacentor silvarum TaxID=543639 RepID=UPI002100825F|nr:uncharacterized protein LOC125941721 [Dermacentor silvarum]
MPIWTHTTTVGSHRICEVDVIRHISKDKISYMHYFYQMVNGTQKKFRDEMEGSFEKPDMYAYEKDRISTKHKHELLFLDEANNCAVIQVLPMSNFVGRSSIDLRIWNSSIRTGPSAKCLKHYYTYEGHGHPIYTCICQNLLSNEHLSPQSHQQLHRKTHRLPKGARTSGKL